MLRDDRLDLLAQRLDVLRVRREVVQRMCEGLSIIISITYPLMKAAVSMRRAGRTFDEVWIAAKFRTRMRRTSAPTLRSSPSAASISHCKKSFCARNHPLQSALNAYSNSDTAAYGLIGPRLAVLGHHAVPLGDDRLEVLLCAVDALVDARHQAAHDPAQTGYAARNTQHTTHDAGQHAAPGAGTRETHGLRKFGKRLMTAALLTTSMVNVMFSLQYSGLRPAGRAGGGRDVSRVRRGSRDPER